MNSEELEKEIQKKLNQVVDRSVMISIIKQRFVVSNLPLSKLSSSEFNSLHGFGGNINQYKIDKFGFFGGVIHE